MLCKIVKKGGGLLVFLYVNLRFSYVRFNHTINAFSKQCCHKKETNKILLTAEIFHFKYCLKKLKSVRLVIYLSIFFTAFSNVKSDRAVEEVLPLPHLMINRKKKINAQSLLSF